MRFFHEHGSQKGSSQDCSVIEIPLKCTFNLVIQWHWHCSGLQLINWPNIWYVMLVRHLLLSYAIWIVALFPIWLHTCDLKRFVSGNQCCSAELIIAWYIWREGRIRILTAATAYLYKCAFCCRFDFHVIGDIWRQPKGCQTRYLKSCGSNT